MIIRKKTSNTKKEHSSSNSSKKNVSKNIIKKEDVILNTENIENTNKRKENIKPQEKEVDSFATQENFEKIDISSIDFKERIERRRGDRRRGYRRIDERSLVSRAQQEAHTIKELAAREGYQNGINKAQEEIEEIKTHLLDFISARDKMYDEFFPYIMEISLEVAQKIIKQEVTMSHDILKNVILSTLDELNSDAQKITIKVNPSDLEFASVSLPEVIETKNKGIKINFMPDETIEVGSCIIIANNGVIDANFKTQLFILQSAFGIYKGGL